MATDPSASDVSATVYSHGYTLQYSTHYADLCDPTASPVARSSATACMMTIDAPCKASTAMIAATTISGQAVPVPPQHPEGSAIGRERSEPDRAHGNGLWQDAVPGVPKGDGEHPSPEQAHRGAFRQGGDRSVSQRHPDDEQANRIIGRVAEEVECVGLQRD
jgi:hypothetical protein